VRKRSLVAASAVNSPTRHLHVGFLAPSRERVDEFWRAGTDAGCQDDGPPGKRPQYTPSYYGAFLRDPDGNSAEAVRHDFVRNGCHIDHLWIRVRDLDAASGFFAATMRHTGLREGRRWPQGRQFRGASATFSLVADGAPVTERLQVAFPAPDRQAVDDFHRDAIAIGGRDASSATSKCTLNPRPAPTASGVWGAGRRPLPRPRRRPTRRRTSAVCPRHRPPPLTPRAAAGAPRRRPAPRPAARPGSLRTAVPRLPAAAPS
jgi:catechol 2,3-dioxygenase-like lactoylglutathione lyase family enzyme